MTADVTRDRKAWNEAVAAAGGHLLQSWEWGEFKSRHGWHVTRVAAPNNAGYAQILLRTKGPFALGYVPRGPVLASDASSAPEELIAAVDRASRSRRAITTILEMDKPLPEGAKTFSPGPDHFQPSRTVKVPLLDDAALLGQMHQKTRYSVRLAQRKGVVAEQLPIDDASIDRFFRLLQDTSSRNEFGIHSRDYYADFLHLFDDHAVLLVATVEGEDAAGLIAARFGTEAIYMYGGSSTQNRAHGAAFLLQFRAMGWARDAGCTKYDLWGIPDLDPPPVSDDGEQVVATKGDDWRGLYRFKTGFGGEIVRYPPTIERRYVPGFAKLARRYYAGREG